jgi:NADPH:quinone reductase-like Zn-dependent oxidoreductase
MMRAYAFTSFGGPEVETFLDLPKPVPGPGELLVAVRATGVNPSDWKGRAGYRRAAEQDRLPIVFGREAAGVVEQVGTGVDGFAVGDAVFGNPSTGGFAEYTLLPVATAAHKPPEVSFVAAATLPVAAATAYDGVHQLGLPPGATLLVTGAGGGVGIAAVQIARHQGLRVLGTASAGKKAYVESFGAIHVPTGDAVADRIKAVAPDGVDGIFDLVGGAHLQAVAGLVADRSKLISAGDPQLVAQVGGAAVQRARNSAVLEAVAALVAAGALDPSVNRTYPLDRAPDALRAVEEGHAQGKIVIEVRAAG